MRLRRPSSASIVLLIAASCGGDASTPGSPAPEAPSFMIIVVDDWARSDLEAVRADGAAWNDLTTIDTLAELGQSWRHFYSQPVCASSRFGLMFGHYLGNPKVGACSRAGKHTPAADTPTLASALRDEGYATAAFGKWHIAAHPDPDEGWENAPGAWGFDTWRAMSASNLGGHCHSKDYTDWYRVDDGVGAQTTEYHTSAVAAAAARWWRTTVGPKLAYVAFQAPHQPLHVPPASTMPGDYPTPRTKREMYDAMLVALDRSLEGLLLEVDLQRSYVFVLGDNGTPSAAVRAPSQGTLRVKASTYQDGVNVPLLVVGPGIGASETESLGHVVDLFATVAELAGGPAQLLPATDSVSLARVLTDPGHAARSSLVCDYVSPRRGEASRTRIELESRGIEEPRTRDVAVLWREEPRGPLLKGRWVVDLESEVTERQLYDLSADPREERPLTGEDAGSRRLEELYQAYLEQHPTRP